MRRGQRIARSIEQALRGEIRLSDLVAAKASAAQARAETFSVPPDVVIDNSLSHMYSVIEVSGLDRPGLLFDLTFALSRLNLNIASAHIVTFGEKAVDAFYVTRSDGRQSRQSGAAGRRAPASARRVQRQAASLIFTVPGAICRPKAFSCEDAAIESESLFRSEPLGSEKALGNNDWLDDERKQPAGRNRLLRRKTPDPRPRIRSRATPNATPPLCRP